MTSHPSDSMAIPTPNKKLDLSSGACYAYIYYPPSKPNKPTLLFLHGFPSTSHDWRCQIKYFKSRGYGILAPDLLGYGGSSKPLDTESYLGSRMSADIISIFDHEKITGKVIAIGHDWGTYLLSQLAFRYPERFEKFVFMSVPYSPPGRAMDVSAINSSTRKSMGFEQFGYWLFLTEDGAGKVIGDNWESFFSVVYPTNSSIWKTAFAPINGLKSFLTSKSRTHIASYISEEEKAYHHAAFGDDYSACLNWYKRGIKNLGVEEEAELLKKGKARVKIGKETLFIAGLKDVVCGAERGASSMKGTVEKGKLKVVDVDAGHWIMLERADETNRVLEDFFEGSSVRSVL